MMESSLDVGGDEAVISFDDDDDDDMADLFSFGVASPSNQSNKKKPVTDYSDAMASVMPIPSNTDNDDNDDGSDRSEDSFLDLLEQQQPSSMLSTIKSILPSSPLRSSNNANSSKIAEIYEEDKDTQDILNWLDEQDNEPKPTENAEEVEEEKETQPPKPPPAPKPEPPPPPPPTFDTLEEAVKSSKSTIKQIRELLDKEKFVVSAKVRPHLWCRVVCGKTLEETLQSSVADSFQHWEQSYNQQQSKKQELKQDATEQQESKDSNGDEEEEDQQLSWLKKESKVLADRIVMVTKGDPQLCQRALISILLNHYNPTGSNKKHQPQQDKNANDTANKATDDNEKEQTMMDPLIPPVACAILSAGVPKVAAAVMLNHIVPSYMPILALKIHEREIAQQRLHRQFYLLACYHLPLLVFHLDRYLPDWYLWPPLTKRIAASPDETKVADQTARGLLPQSWLLSHLAGECQGTFMNPKWLLSLWDLILTSSNNSLRFFLVMAILEMHSDQLLLLTDQALKEEVHRIMQFKENITGDGFGIEAEDETTTTQATGWVHEWVDRAHALWEATPTSVIRKLKRLEDEAVKEALTKRQEQAEERLRLKLEAQAKAHQDALEAERDEARLRLTRARLIAFYRTHNPGKEDNIDKIMKNYKGRYDVLDAKLKQKYGVGFNPALKPKPLTKNANNILSTMNVGIGARRNFFGGGHDNGKKDELVIPESEKKEKVTVTVQPSEILPILCWSKQGNVERLARMTPSSKQDEEDDKRMPLKYYLVDSRPESAALEQGRFPTSVSLSPETMLDADLIQQHEDMFESLRGAVHICIMGEGFSALPGLYGHKMTQGLYDYIKEDESRNNLCALFFIKKGFPFVSVMDGGFASAHAWLCRDGPKNHHLKASNVLTDYNPEVSLFGQFESLYQEQQHLANAPAREKAQRALQGLFDTSITALARNTRVFESTASDMEATKPAEQPNIFETMASEMEASKQGYRRNIVKKFFAANPKESSAPSSTPANTNANQAVTKVEETGGQDEPTGDGTTPPSSAFLNRFARKPHGAVLSRESSEGSLVVESVDFENQSDDGMPKAGTDDGNQDASVDKHPSARTPPTNKFAMFRQQGQQVGNDANAVNQAVGNTLDNPSSTGVTETKGNNRFGGLGAALNNARIHNPIKVGGAAAVLSNPNKGLARIPFARFGMNPNNAQNGETQATNSAGAGVGMARNLAGLNQFRKKTMERMRAGGANNDSSNVNTLVVEDEPRKNSTDSDDGVIEESVSFDQSSPAISSSTVTENDTQNLESATVGESNTSESGTGEGDKASNASPKPAEIASV